VWFRDGKASPQEPKKQENRKSKMELMVAARLRMESLPLKEEAWVRLWEASPLKG
jgi:hypothetical protein